MSPTVAKRKSYPAGELHADPISFRSKRKADEIDAFIAERIRLLRENAGLSQMEMAAQLGISHQQYQKYEAGLNRISGSAIVRCARILSVPVASLLPADRASIDPGPAPAPAVQETQAHIPRSSEVLEFAEICDRIVKLQSPRLRAALQAVLDELRTDQDDD